jgi:protein gp37
MAENTSISWADHTFNPWIGCTKVSPACDGCYAAHLMGGGRYKRVEWGEPGKGEGTRSRTAPANWRKPLAWNRKAAAAPGQTFVFCASLADVFDTAVPMEWRRDLFDLIHRTPNLTWLLLTKRPGMIVNLFNAQERNDCALSFSWPRNAAIGCTVVTQAEADRDVPKLLQAKAVLNPAFAFLSMEPLLGPVDLTSVRRIPGAPKEFMDALRGTVWTAIGSATTCRRILTGRHPGPQDSGRRVAG